MRLLLVHQYYQEKDGAGGARFNEMVKSWQELGHEVTVITGNLSQRGKVRKEEYKGKFVKRVNQDGVEVLRCFVSKAYNKNFIGRFWAYISFVLSATYAGLFKAKAKYDTILVTSPPLFVGFIALILSKLKRTPYVFEIRDLWPESAIDTGIIKNKTIISIALRFEKILYKNASLINVLTPAFYETLIQKKNVPESKLIEIPNASDFRLSDKLLDTFDSQLFRKEHNLEGRFVFIYIGAHGKANGLHQVLEVAERVRDTNALFILIGDGMKKDRLLEEKNNKNLDNVIFHDPIPKKEVLKYVAASDMGISILIKNDTFKTIYSNKTFDYMSCKKPIIMVIDGISRKLVESADAGVYVEPENIADFESKIRYYIANQEIIGKQGLNGYNYAKKHFDREVLAKKYISELENRFIK